MGHYVKQLVRAGGRVPPQLAHEVPACGAQMKGTDDFGVLHVGELGALLGETPDVVPQGLVRLLTTPSKNPGVPRAHVCALEVAHEDLDQVGPVMDLVREQVLEPRSCGVSKMKGKVEDDNCIFWCTAQLVC